MGAFRGRPSAAALSPLLTHLKPGAEKLHNYVSETGRQTA
jgi:hypothetical protein